jgi:uncharacterized membrane protein
MDTLPLHPALVHLPIGIAFLLPLLGFGLLFAIVRGWYPRQAWAVMVIVSGLALGTAVSAQRAGDADEDRLKGAISRQAIHDHEEAAETFTTLLGVLTVASAGAFFLRKELFFRTALAVLSFGAFGVLGSGLLAARKGGELVYKLGACAPGKAPAPAAGTTGPEAPAVEPGEKDHRD